MSSDLRGRPLWRQVVWLALWASMPWHWRELRDFWRQHSAPLQEGEAGPDGVWQLSHPRVRSALETLIHAFRATPGAENYLRWECSVPDGSTLEPGEWRVVVVRPGGWDPHEQAVTYQQALIDAGVPVPPTPEQYRRPSWADGEGS